MGYAPVDWTGGPGLEMETMWKSYKQKVEIKEKFHVDEPTGNKKKEGGGQDQTD